MNATIERDEILGQKIPYVKKDCLKIVYLFRGDELVWIGKSSKIKVQNYIYNKSLDFTITHYTTTTPDANMPKKEIDNFIAEQVLIHQPCENKSVPKNTRFISFSKAKREYNFNEEEFVKILKSKGGYVFEGLDENKPTPYIDAKQLEDVYGEIPSDDKIPRIGKEIIVMERKRFEELFETLKSGLGAGVKLKALLEMYEHVYMVVKYKAPKEFIVSNDSTKKKLSVDEFGDVWHHAISKCKQTDIIQKSLTEGGKTPKELAQML